MLQNGILSGFVPGHHTGNLLQIGNYSQLTTLLLKNSVMVKLYVLTCKDITMVASYLQHCVIFGWLGNQNF